MLTEYRWARWDVSDLSLTHAAYEQAGPFLVCDCLVLWQTFVHVTRPADNVLSFKSVGSGDHVLLGRLANASPLGPLWRQRCQRPRAALGDLSLTVPFPVRMCGAIWGHDIHVASRTTCGGFWRFAPEAVPGGPCSRCRHKWTPSPLEALIHRTISAGLGAVAAAAANERARLTATAA